MRTRAGAEPRRLTALSASEADAAWVRYQFLQPTLEQAIPLTQVARHAGVPLRTARR